MGKEQKTGGSNMTISLRAMRNIVLGLSLLMGSAAVFSADDGQIQAEVSRFADENAKLREDHIQAMRELHVKHINEMYDRKMANVKELNALWRQLKPGDRKANKDLREQIKDKQEAFKKEEEKFRKEFKENVLKKKNEEFHDSMKARLKDMKKKFKD